MGDGKNVMEAVTIGAGGDTGQAQPQDLAMIRFKKCLHFHHMAFAALRHHVESSALPVVGFEGMCSMAVDTRRELFAGV